MTDIQNAAPPAATAAAHPAEVEDVAAGQPAEAVSVTDLLNAGVHFGHQSKRWNPKMKRFIFEKRSGIYIIDLAKTLAQLELAKKFIFETVARGKNVLFVGTKRQSQEIIKTAALRCGQHYVISRWLGGTLTNFQNIANSTRHMQAIQALEQKGALETMPQKEASALRHELERLARHLTGIANMKNMPGAMVVVDINREAIAVREAKRVGIPVVAFVDTNCNPDPIDYPIPANDDSARSIKLIIQALAEMIVKAGAEYERIRASLPPAPAVEAGPAEAPPRKTGRPGHEKRPRHSLGARFKPAEKKEVSTPPEPPAAPLAQPAPPASP